jgi:hypothetical protein
MISFDGDIPEHRLYLNNDKLSLCIGFCIKLEALIVGYQDDHGRDRSRSY